MPDFTVSTATIKQIADIATPHLKALNDDIAAEYPDAPDHAFTLAVGFALSTLLSALSDPQERANAIDGINLLTRITGYALTPVT